MTAKTKNTSVKNKEGRPTSYKPEYCNRIVEYFSDESIKPLPLFEKFAHEIGVCRSTLYNWADEHAEFLDAIKKAKEIQEARWITASLNNDVNVTFAIFMGKNCFGWKDARQHEFGGDGNGVKKISVEFVDADNSSVS